MTRSEGPASPPGLPFYDKLRTVEHTWDGQPVAREPPFAACVVVWRRSSGGREFLVLHRHHGGPDWEGDWAWTPPSGARQPGESAAAAARRELLEETGLELQLAGIPHETDDVALFVAEAQPGGAIALDAEHDRFAWLPLDAAAPRCLPAIVARAVALADEWVERRGDCRR